MQMRNGRGGNWQRRRLKVPTQCDEGRTQGFDRIVEFVGLSLPHGAFVCNGCVHVCVKSRHLGIQLVLHSLAFGVESLFDQFRELADVDLIRYQIVASCVVLFHTTHCFFFFFFVSTQGERAHDDKKLRFFLLLDFSVCSLNNTW